MTTTAVCPICASPQVDGIACHSCTSVLERDLGDVAAIVAELDVTLSKQARIGGGGTGGLARERTPIDVGAMQAADNLGNVLTTWARDVCNSPGWEPVSDVPHRVLSAITAARLLLRVIPAIRRHPAVAELVDEITDAIRQARRAVDRPADRVYLGQCLAPTPDEEGREVTCLAELYARPNAGEVVCRVCGVEHEVGERRAWLLQRAADMLFTVPHAAQMMGDVGHIKVTEASIRGYIHRKRISYRPGGKMIRLGDLLAVVIDDSERKGAA